MGSELLVVLPGFLFLGVIVGISAGLLGIGGGLILVPGLYYLLGHSDLNTPNDNFLIHVALATSMAIILPTTLSSSWAQIKRKAVDWELIRKMAPGLIIGVTMGVAMVSKIDGEIIKVIFSVGLTLIACSMIFRKETSRSFPFLTQIKWVLPFSTLFGILATFLGIGGAVLNVPYLNRAGIPLRTAIATGSVLGAIVAFVATFSYAWTAYQGPKYVDLLAVLMIVPISVVMAPIGVKISHAMPVAKLRILFSTLLMLVALKMLSEVI